MVCIIIIIIIVIASDICNQKTNELHMTSCTWQLVTNDMTSFFKIKICG